MVSKKSNHHACEGGIKNPSLMITDCHNSASLVMPIGDPPDGFFHPTLILMIDTYNPCCPDALRKVSAQSDRSFTPEGLTVCEHLHLENPMIPIYLIS